MLCPAWCRFGRLLGHVVLGLLVILAVFPFLSGNRRWRLIHWWAGRLLRILNIRVRVVGALPAGGGLLVANHVSWLDIHLIHSLLPARFVSKAAVRGWPVLGRLAEAAGTLFLERSRRADAARVNAVIAGHLEAGDCLAFFPEGTTTNGRDILPFHPSLFQPAIDASATIFPTVIRYLDANGQPTNAAAYIGEMSLLDSICSILRQPAIRAEVTFLSPVSPAGALRKALAADIEATMRQALAAVAPCSSPETDVHPPA